MKGNRLDGLREQLHGQLEDTDNGGSTGGQGVGHLARAGRRIEYQKQ